MIEAPATRRGARAARWATRLVMHHTRRLAAVRAILDGGALTGYEVASELFGALSPQQSRLGLVEALAHLEYLRRRGAVTAGQRGRGVAYRGTQRFSP